MAGKYDDLDLGGLQLKCNEKTDETLESTRRMLNMCSEAKQVIDLNFFNFQTLHLSGWNENPHVPRRPS